MILPRSYALLATLLLALFMAGCSSTSERRGASTSGGGGYYKDDGPGSNPPPNLDAIPDAVPRIEPLASGANRPYVVFGKRYVPDLDDDVHRQEGVASWYGRKFHGNSTSNGETYDMYAMTAAHPTLPIPSYARVTSKVNGRTVIVRVNDRGPFHSDRIMDLSYVAAWKLGLIAPGSGQVTVERILPDEINSMIARNGAGGAGNEPIATPIADAGGAQASVLPVVATLPATTPARPASAAPGVSTGAVSMAATPAVSATAGGFYLQLGAFGQQANAQALANRINTQLEAGTPPAVITQTNNLYRVKIGPYANRDAALGAVQQVSARTGILPTLAAQ
ncbi:septal ring lytic transglycosylase RlpA family protein [Bordetella genomosp. 13]|uniref:septal ring lytic transglycosylase RlpA family protein n=1 Tax=Bordetella genomosp. 13 TaxID=463040 RepID=UPI0011A2341E|nr:septal ring lytic transglycosylase RlpA family protein [Bordetella genomosp. 13]